MTVDDELYTRTFLNDLGAVTTSSGVTEQIDIFNLTAQSTFTLTQTPNANYTPLVYFNNVLKQSPEFYSIAGTAGTLVAPQTGTLIVRYWF